MAYTEKCRDTFTDTNFTTLDAHTPTPSGGFAWDSFSGANLVIFSNALNNPAATDFAVIISLAFSANQAAQCVITQPGNQPYLLLNAAFSSGNFTGYAAQIFSTFGCYLYKFDGSGIDKNELTHSTTTWTAADTFRFESDGNGGLSVYRNGSGTPDVSYTDGTPITSGSPGIGGGGGEITSEAIYYEDAGGAATWPGYISPFGWRRNKKYKSLFHDELFREQMKHAPLLKVA